ncbi:hypothetical protein C2U50_23270 [Klebsiella pneumoniae]|nr:hypothetical protein C2U50_23270 [Klebsiella pneumoniae]AUY18723.1 hypothetical protein C3F39_07970 [Klebsiella pneumoniae]
MMSLWDALRMNMMISYQELVRTFPKAIPIAEKNKPGGLTRSRLSALRADTARFKKGYLYTSAVASKLGPCSRAAVIT